MNTRKIWTERPARTDDYATLSRHLQKQGYVLSLEPVPPRCPGVIFEGAPLRVGSADLAVVTRDAQMEGFRARVRQDGDTIEIHLWRVGYEERKPFGAQRRRY